MFASLPSLNSLRVFEAAARHQSFTVAADELSVTQGAVSYQIRRLEGGLGIDLFRRKTRQVALTVEGERLFRAVHRLLRDLDDEVRSISPRSDRMVLTVAVSTYVAARWLSPRLGRFFSAHPEITLRLQHAVNDPTFAVEDVDMAIRWGDGNWPGVASELLLASPMMPVCAPGLIDGGATARGPEDLIGHTLLHDQPGIDLWGEWFAKAGGEAPPARAGLTITDPNVRVQAAMDGQGVVLADCLIENEIAAERLVAPFDVVLDGYGFHMLYESGAARRPAFRRFRDWLLSEASDP